MSNASACGCNEVPTRTAAPSAAIPAGARSRAVASPRRGSSPVGRAASAAPIGVAHSGGWGLSAGGAAHARAELFQGATWFLTPSVESDPERLSALHGTVAAIGALGTVAALRPGAASASTLTVPEVDQLKIRVVVDSSYDLFFRPNNVQGVSIQPPPRAADFRRGLHNEWGLSLWMESRRASEERTVMLDYGYSSNVLFNKPSCGVTSRS